MTILLYSFTIKNSSVETKDNQLSIFNGRHANRACGINPPFDDAALSFRFTLIHNNMLQDSTFSHHKNIFKIIFKFN